MLVLTRKLGETIRIGDLVKVTVLEVRAGQVKLGIEAPNDVKVHREEVYSRIQAELRRGETSAPTSGGGTGERGPGSAKASDNGPA